VIDLDSMCDKAMYSCQHKDTFLALKISQNDKFDFSEEPWPRSMKYNGRSPPYHMSIHALQMVLHLNKKYLSDVQLPHLQ